ncbi:MAG: aminopeptidase P family protein [Chloroflexaceae bacterium]|nr:aminopeptidase P family protein [Chloroflexaceae bacterium]
MTKDGNDQVSQRLTRLRSLLQERAIEAFLVTSAPNRRYLSGFRGSSGVLLITQDTATIFTDFRYRVQVTREAPRFTLREISGEHPFPKVLAATVREMQLRAVAFEAHAVAVAQHQAMVEACHEAASPDPAPSLHPVEDLVAPLREVKDSNELALLRRAIAITDAAVEAVLPSLRPDQTERQAAWMLEVAMRERGAEGVAFPLIVAAGPNAAQPHAEAGDDLLGTGRPIVIDMGSRFQGYHADMTRTVVLGEPDDRFWTIYDLVLGAQSCAVAGIRPGMSGVEADALARERIEAAGFGKEFGHGLGHGVGLDIHEGPRLRRGEPQQTLRVGNVFSVEPGIYLEGWGGVRIEDLVLLHVHGCEVLTHASKQPVVSPSG